MVSITVILYVIIKTQMEIQGRSPLCGIFLLHFNILNQFPRRGNWLKMHERRAAEAEQSFSRQSWQSLCRFRFSSASYFGRLIFLVVFVFGRIRFLVVFGFSRLRFWRSSFLVQGRLGSFGLVMFIRLGLIRLGCRVSDSDIRYLIFKKQN